MSFGTSSPYLKFLELYDIKPGFGGLPDLAACFGELQDETSFVRDRVSPFQVNFWYLRLYFTYILYFDVHF